MPDGIAYKDWIAARTVRRPGAGSRTYLRDGDASFAADGDRLQPRTPPGEFPPVDPQIGEIWLMTPENHAAMFTSTGWIPLYPPTDNEAVAAGNALLGIDGLWIALDGD